MQVGNASTLFVANLRRVRYPRCGRNLGLRKAEARPLLPQALT